MGSVQNTAEVVVYSSPSGHCQPCRITKKLLDKLGVRYLDIQSDACTAEALRTEGWRSFPVVKTPDGDWEGYRPDLCRALVES